MYEARPVSNTILLQDALFGRKVTAAPVKKAETLPLTGSKDVRRTGRSRLCSAVGIHLATAHRGTARKAATHHSTRKLARLVAETDQKLHGLPQPTGNRWLLWRPTIVALKLIVRSIRLLVEDGSRWFAACNQELSTSDRKKTFVYNSLVRLVIATEKRPLEEEKQ